MNYLPFTPSKSVAEFAHAAFDRAAKRYKIKQDYTVVIAFVENPRVFYRGEHGTSFITNNKIIIRVNRNHMDPQIIGEVIVNLACAIKEITKTTDNVEAFLRGTP